MLSLNIKNTRYDGPTETIAASLYSWVGRKTASGYGGGSFNGDSKSGNQSMQGLNWYGIRGSFNGKLQTDGEQSMQVVMQGLNWVRVVLTRNSKRTGNDPCKSICKD